MAFELEFLTKKKECWLVFYSWNKFFLFKKEIIIYKYKNKINLWLSISYEFNSGLFGRTDKRYWNRTLFMRIYLWAKIR